MVYWKFCAFLPGGNDRYHVDNTRDREELFRQVQELSDTDGSRMVFLNWGRKKEGQTVSSRQTETVQALGILAVGTVDGREAKACAKEYLEFCFGTGCITEITMKILGVSGICSLIGQADQDWKLSLKKYGELLGLNGLEVFEGAGWSDICDSNFGKTVCNTMGDVEQEQIARAPGEKMEAELKRYLHEDPKRRVPRLYVGYLPQMYDIQHMMKLRYRLGEDEQGLWVMFGLGYDLDPKEREKEQTLQDRLTEFYYPLLGKGTALLLLTEKEKRFFDKERVRKLLSRLEECPDMLIFLFANASPGEMWGEHDWDIRRLAESCSTRRVLDLRA